MRAAVLSGGGWKAAFQVGVLRGLLDQNPDLDYDIYTGASAGALNAAILSQGSLKEQLPILEEIWLKRIKGSSSIWSHKLLPRLIAGAAFPVTLMTGALLTPYWQIALPLGIASAAAWYIPYHILTRTNSIYSTKPLNNLINEFVNEDKIKSSGKKLIISCVDYKSGEMILKTEQDDSLQDYVKASSAFPVFFPMVMGAIDGGTRENAPLKAAVSAGANHIDVFVNSPLQLPNANKASMLDAFKRTIEVMSNEILLNDIKWHKHFCNQQYKVYVSEYVENSDLLNFDPVHIKAMYEDGKKAAYK